MSSELLLHVSKSDYTNLISQLEGKLGEMGTLLSDYQALKNNVNSFMRDTDSSFEKMQENVQNNIDAVRRGIGITQKSKDSLQRTVDQMESMSSNVGRMMDEASTLARNTIRAAITLEDLGLL